MRVIALFLLLAVFFACDKPVIEKQYNYFALELHHCITTNIQGADVNICMDSVHDSRCPLNVECIWAGEATVNFSLQTHGLKQSFKLSTFNNPPYFRNDTTILGYKIKLLSVTPYPGSNSQDPYKAELSITP